MDVRTMRNHVLGMKVVKSLESRNMEAYFVETKEEAVKKALELMPQGSSISWGGTMSVTEVGLMEAIQQGEYVLYDRDQAETPEEREDMMRKANQNPIFAESFFC